MDHGYSEWIVAPSNIEIKIINTPKFAIQLFPSASLSTPTLTITLNFDNVTHEGHKILSVPINTAPINGKLTISPTTGTSLSTEFTIKASDWEDEDTPL